jgi:hypothetical protein
MRAVIINGGVVIKVKRNKIINNEKVNKIINKALL